MSHLLLPTIAIVLMSYLPTAFSSQALPTEKAELLTTPRTIMLEGTVEAVRQATMSAQISERIVEFNYDVEDFVPAGAVVARFRDTEQRAGYEAAKAGLSEAQALHKDAELEYKRTSDLFQKKLVAASEKDRAEAALKAAQARLKSAQARLDQAKEQLGHTVLRAPYSGIVTRRHAEVGEAVRAGAPIVSGLSLDSLRVSVDVPQRYVENVRAAKKVSVILDSGQVLESRKLIIFPYANSLSRTFKMRVYLPTGVKGLFPGMFTKVTFAADEHSRVVVPAKAIVKRSEVTAVYVRHEDGRIAMRQIRIGEEAEGDHVVVLAGLSAGEQVFLDPQAATVALKQQMEEAE